MIKIYFVNISKELSDMHSIYVLAVHSDKPYCEGSEFWYANTEKTLKKCFDKTWMSEYEFQFYKTCVLSDPSEINPEDPSIIVSKNKLNKHIKITYSKVRKGAFYYNKEFKAYGHLPELPDLKKIKGIINFCEDCKEFMTFYCPIHKKKEADNNSDKIKESSDNIN